MNGQDYWATHHGSKAISGLLIGIGLLVMVLTQYIFTEYSETGFNVSICFIVAGAIGLLIR